MRETRIIPHYADLDLPWSWPNFAPVEVACRHCGELFYDAEAMDALQRLRGIWGRPIIINSGHRCAAHNTAVHGAEHSPHLKIAFDCRCDPADQDAFIAAAHEAGFTGIGRYSSFVHLDTGPAREWDKRAEACGDSGGGAFGLAPPSQQ